LKKISFSLRIGIIGNIEFIKEIFFESLSSLTLDSNLSEGNYEFLMVFRQIPIKIKIFLAENLENIINDFENIQKLDIIILTLNLYEADPLRAINKKLLKDFNEIFSFQGLSVLVEWILNIYLRILLQKVLK